MESKTVIDGDFHIHSIFSDGVNTYDEIVDTAKVIDLNRIAICDHSDEYMQFYRAPRLQGFFHGAHRWKNIRNNIEVTRGLELDLLDEKGSISDLSHYRHLPIFLILSVHKGVYKGDAQKVSRAYIEAISKNHEVINILGHPCSTYFGGGDDGIQIKEVVEVANAFGIGIEVNGANLLSGKTDIEKLKYVCTNTKLLYLNSDAHSTYEMIDCRCEAIKFALSFRKLSLAEEKSLVSWYEKRSAYGKQI